MRRFEQDALRRFTTVVAVSHRDAESFRADFGATNVRVIKTGVDLSYFSHSPPTDAEHVVFTGSMDWLANRDGIEFYMDDVWPLIAKRAPSSRMTVVGRDPPSSLISKMRERELNWRFTGYVDDIREHVRSAGVYVIPLRVGGGTRLKVYEAMAMGCPIVSTSIGVEGLPLTAGEHYLRADTASDFAAAMLRLMADGDLRMQLSTRARLFVEENSSYETVAKEFEQICDDTIAKALAYDRGTTRN
jgi:glycosyltransferase involved in cell wall biosynthesis